MHNGTPEGSVRLRLTRDVLLSAGLVGATTAQIQEATGSMAPGTDVSELRHAGYDIVCTYEGRSPVGRKVYRYILIGLQRQAAAIAQRDHGRDDAQKEKALP